MISIVMGSQSDYPVMQEAKDILEEFGVDYEIKIVSAHRTPHRLFEYAKNARDNNICIIIAGAGGAAHLPGMIASMTTVPVIGVPIMSKTMSGIDSLYSIVQMPPGIPVATMAINGSKNAALLALQILSITDQTIHSKLTTFRKKMESEVIDSSIIKFGK